MNGLGEHFKFVVLETRRFSRSAGAIAPEMIASRVSPMAISPDSLERPIAAKNVSAHMPAGELVSPRASMTDVKVGKLKEESVHIACRCATP